MATKKKPLLIAVTTLILVAGVAAKMLLATPAPAEKSKVHGSVYPLHKEFVLSLHHGTYAKLNVGFVISHEEAGPVEVAAKPPEGYGSLPQEALVRSAVTETLTGAEPQDFRDRSSRRDLKRRIMRLITRTSDVKVVDVLFSDFTVQ